MCIRDRLRGVEDLGSSIEPVETVPLRLQSADGRAVFALQFDPIDIVEAVRKQLVQLLVEVPMPQFGVSSSITDVAI